MKARVAGGGRAVPVLDPLLAATRALSRVGVWVGGALLIAASLVIAVEVLIRKAFGATIGGADELSGYALAVSSAWAYGFALIQRAHVRIDSLYVTLPTRVCAALDILGLTLFLVFFALVTAYAYEVLALTVELGSRSMTPLQTPLVIPQAIWFAGLAFFCVVAALHLLRAAVLFATGDAGAVQRLIGSRTVGEDVAEELRR